MSDPRISYGSSEKPRYSALRHRIDAYYAALLAPLAKLRASCFKALTLPDPAKEAGDEEEFEYLGITRQVIDDAVTLFLQAMAGPDRSAAGFSAPGAGPVQADGVIQEQDTLAFATGIARGADLLEKPPTLSAVRQSPAVREMLDNAFARLSENGKLRLEAVRDDIHGVLASAQAAGLNPVETARQLGQQFDQYSGYEFQRLARTEAAFASEAGVRAQMAELGVERVEILVSADACDECQEYDGQVFAIDDTGNLPPYHPNCLCATAPAGPVDQEAEDQGDTPDG